jgi:hypothetical protein
MQVMDERHGHPVAAVLSKEDFDELNAVDVFKAGALGRW